MLETRAPARAPAARPRPARGDPRPPGPPGPADGRRADAAALLVLLVAFALRMWHLGWKSLWLDEGISVTFSIDGPPRLFDLLVERDIHPPLYYLALWAWTRVGGLGETSVRFPSVLVGVLLVALLYRLARDLYPGWPGRATALLAASLAALSPFLIYYSQEARMYGALATAGLAATVALRRALEARRPAALARWGVYALAMAVPPYLHHFGWMLFAFHGAFVALASWRYRWRALGWLAAVAAAGLAYLPWLGPLGRQVSRLRDTPDFWLGALSLWFVAQHAFAAFAVGFGGALERYALVLALFVGVFAIGALLIAWRGLLRGRTDDLLVVLYLAVPTALLYAIVASNPKFADRYLIVVVPAFLLLLARGVVGIGELGARLRGRLRPLGLGAAGLAVALALGLIAISTREAARVYDDDAYSKEDYRAAVDYLIHHWQTGDAVLLMLDSYQVFDYYSHGRLTRYGLNPTDDLAFAAGELNKIVEQRHPRLWVLLWNPDWSDPSGAVRAMLDETLERQPLDLESFHRLPVRLYALSGGPRFDGRVAPTTPSEARFGDALRLLGVEVDASRLASGDRRPIRLFWEPLRPIAEELSISLRLTRDGREWWRWDGGPAAHSYPTTYWKPGRPVRGSPTVEAPVGTPPGRYQLEMVVYSPVSGQPLAVQVGDRPPAASLTLATVEVAPAERPPDLARLPVAARPAADLGGVELVGGQIEPTALDAGSPLELALAWRAPAPTTARRARPLLVDALGRELPLGADAPLGGSYPLEEWRAGEVVVERLPLTVPAGAAAGEARLIVTVAADGQAAARRAEVGRVAVRSRPRSFAAPTPTRALGARVGEVATLVGVDAPASVARGEPLGLTLHWQARAETSTGYAVFVHLVGADDRPVAQRDGPPGGGTLPTSGWLAGEYLRDAYALPVPPGLEPGQYRVVVGLYDPRSGQRLPVSGPGADGPDRVAAATVEVR